jgi:Fur family transcriptional regulator, stress-responsive regulator
VGVSETAAPLTIAERIRGAGLRVTAPRVAVLDTLHAMPHAHVDDLLTAVRTTTEVSSQAVYDVLHAFTKAGLVRRIEPAGSSARFEVRVGDNHHHIVCRSCGQVADVDCAVGTAPCLDPSDAQQFLIDEAEVTFWGLCPKCQTSSEVDEDPHS